MSIYYQNWEELNVNWEDEQRLWEEIYVIVVGSGARDPQELEREIARNLEKLPEPKKEKLITVLIKLGNEDYKEKKKKKEGIKVTVKDVQTIMTDYLKIEISKKD
jgi:UDP-N-acetylglucosamine:LPS N-acetylglucosamine transferase